ncbi:DUF4253 domain-containing protein [Kitasatospora sp. MBT63]|uniref:DUF4253 domain-containing protein n=1 Tax=Kitasatospora sp. MBT63 TaxID=1444768 RepID=UPI00068994D3|nr:DUF4253 domain-containing protein [Kitasatospora sp. MBT63]
MLDALARAERARGDGSSGVLAQAGRSTDVPALARRHDLPEPWESDPAELSAVLRSWEERFGTRLVLLERERLILSVAAPPSTTDAAQAVAAEHFAFAPDTITQGDHETLRPYAAHEVLGRRMWSFWWD